MFLPFSTFLPKREANDSMFRFANIYYYTTSAVLQSIHI